MRKCKANSSGESADRQKQAPEYFRPLAASQYTGVSESTLAKLRMRCNRPDGPKCAKMNGCVIYRRVDLDEWIERHAVFLDG